MSDTAAVAAATAAAAQAASTAATTTAATTAPWYDGKADAETLGHWQNKLSPDVLKDPVQVALEMTRRHRESEKFIGAPADQILRLPKDAKDEAGWKDVWTRLGAPKEAKDYDFSAVKFADGTAIEDSFAEAIRQTAFAQHVPKDTATAFAQSVVKFMEGADASEKAELGAKLATEKAVLAKDWGPNADLNRLTAMQGAKRLGVTPDEINALENVVGYAKIMEMFRKIGAGTSEDTFVEGKGGGNPTTAHSATARLAELQSDQAWAKRLLAGDAAARREFTTLTEQIAGVSEAAA